jgi:hypothetical protein
LVYCLLTIEKLLNGKVIFSPNSPYFVTKLPVTVFLI